MDITKFITSVTFKDKKYNFIDLLGDPRFSIVIPLESTKEKYKLFIYKLVLDSCLSKRNGLFMSEFRQCGNNWQSYYNYILDAAINYDVLVIELIDLHLGYWETKKLLRAIKDLDKKTQIICTSYDSQVIELFYESERIRID
jgi:hypothetical protein